MPQLHAPPADTPEAADAALLEALTGVVLAAARAAADGPREVGDARDRARAVINEALADLAPGTPAISEDRPPSPGAQLDSEHLLFDVEDAEGGALVLSVAVVRARTPSLGVVYAPALARLWSATPAGAWAADAPADVGVGPFAPICVRAAPEGGVTAVAESADRSPELEAFLSAYHASARRAASAAVGLCLLAEGKADMFPHLGRSRAWSTAAGDAVLRSAGGRTVTLEGANLLYPASAADNGFANPRFVALGSIGLKTPEPA